MILREVKVAKTDELKAYLAGSAHDATFSRLHRTVRFGQADRRWLSVLRSVQSELGLKSWIYREGRNRDFWILESCANSVLQTVAPVELEPPAAMAYARGYFDADGGLPRNLRARLYLQFAQKDRRDLLAVRDLLERQGILCGVLHQPSAKVDPDYWRFFIRAQSHLRYLERVGSWHPSKRQLMNERLALLRVPT